MPLIAKFMIYKIKNCSATQKVAVQKSFKELRADSSPLKALLFLLLSSKTQNLTEQFTLYLFFPVQRNQTLTDHAVPNHLNLKELNGKERYQIPQTIRFRHKQTESKQETADSIHKLKFTKTLPSFLKTKYS